MQLMAISIESASSGWRVPSLRELCRKSTMASANFLRESVACRTLIGSLGLGDGVYAYHLGYLFAVSSSQSLSQVSAILGIVENVTDETLPTSQVVLLRRLVTVK